MRGTLGVKFKDFKVCYKEEKSAEALHTPGRCVRLLFVVAQGCAQELSCGSW